jgi:hypothetical protein
MILYIDRRKNTLGHRKLGMGSAGNRSASGDPWRIGSSWVHEPPGFSLSGLAGCGSRASRSELLPGYVWFTSSPEIHITGCRNSQNWDLRPSSGSRVAGFRSDPPLISLSHDLSLSLSISSLSISLSPRSLPLCSVSRRTERRRKEEQGKRRKK